MGLFRDLVLTHLIPSSRLREDYLLRLVEAMSYTSLILFARRGKLPRAITINPLRSYLGKLKRRLTISPRKRRFLEAKLRGQLRGINEASSWNKTST
jgi:hypothetical protein